MVRKSGCSTAWWPASSILLRHSYDGLFVNHSPLRNEEVSPGTQLEAWNVDEKLIPLHTCIFTDQREAIRAKTEFSLLKRSKRYDILGYGASCFVSSSSESMRHGIKMCHRHRRIISANHCFFLLCHRVPNINAKIAIIGPDLLYETISTPRLKKSMY